MQKENSALNTENKVLRETISDERHSIADLTLESQDQKNAMELLESSLRDNQKIVNQLLGGGWGKALGKASGRRTCTS